MSSPWRGVRQGLSKFQQPSGLLRNIKGRRKDGVNLVDDIPATEMQTKNEDDEAWLTRAPDSSDSEDDRHRTADIVPTVFRTESAAKSSSSGTTRKFTQGKQPSPGSESIIRMPQESRESSTTGSKRSADDITESPGSHLVGSAGFTKAKKIKRTFGKGSQKQAQIPKVSRVESASPAKTRFKRPESIDRTSPVKGGKSVKHGRKPSSSGSPAKRKFTTNAALGDSPEEPQKTFIKPKVDSFEKSPTRRSTRGSQNGKRLRKNGKATAEEDTKVEEISPLRKFKKHFLDDYDDLKDLSDDESKPVPSTQQVARILHYGDAGLNSDSDLSSLDDEMFPKEPRCPMCDELVDQELFNQHVAKTRMNIKKQTAFCRLHKRKEAQSAQRTKGYPQVNWATLESRFGKHDILIREILEGEKPSYYADLLTEKVEAGENRTLLRTEESLIPGYYGPRGLRVMGDYIIKTFSDTLRKRAIEDRLVSSRGHTGYVQAVLVPELAVRLIMDDMGVSEEEARKIMLESSDVGELVHEETRDIVRGNDEK